MGLGKKSGNIPGHAVLGKTSPPPKRISKLNILSEAEEGGCIFTIFQESILVKNVNYDKKMS